MTNSSKNGEDQGEPQKPEIKYFKVRGRYYAVCEKFDLVWIRYEWGDRYKRNNHWRRQTKKSGIGFASEHAVNELDKLTTLVLWSSKPPLYSGTAKLENLEGLADRRGKRNAARAKRLSEQPYYHIKVTLEVVKEMTITYVAGIPHGAPLEIRQTQTCVVKVGGPDHGIVKGEEHAKHIAEELAAQSFGYTKAVPDREATRVLRTEAQ